MGLLQVPFIQKELLMLGNLVLESRGYSYSVDRVVGLFPFFIKVNHLQVFKGKDTLLEGHVLHLDWRRLAAERLVMHSTHSEETTDWEQLRRIVKQFDFFKIIQVSNAHFAGYNVSLFFTHKKHVQRFSLLSNGDEYFEIYSYFLPKRGVISVKTLGHSHDIHVKYGGRSFELIFQDLLFRSDHKLRKGKLSYKNQTVDTVLSKNILTLRYQDFIAKMDFSKWQGSVQYQNKAPILFAWQSKNNQITLWTSPHRFAKYDITQGVGLISFDQCHAIFKDLMFKHVHVDLPKWYNLKADGWLTLQGLPFLNISANFYNQLPLVLNIAPKTFDFATDYCVGSGRWNLSEVVLTELCMQGATLKQETKLYPLIDHVELVNDFGQVVLTLENCNYFNFDRLQVDWPLFLPFVHCHLKADITHATTLNGLLEVLNIKTPFADKTADMNVQARNNKLAVKVLLAKQPFITGNFNLDQYTGGLDFNSGNQELASEGNELIGNISGQIKIRENWDLKGDVKIEKGYFENVDVGLIISNIHGNMHFDNGLIQFEAGSDHCVLKGQADFKTKESSYSLMMKDYTLLQSDLIQLTLSGGLSGTVFPLHAQGSLEINKAVVTVEDIPLQQTFDILSNAVKRPSLHAPLTADIKVKALDTIDINAFISQSTWGGECAVRVTPKGPSLDGLFTAKKGSAELLGRTMMLKHGSVTFVPEDSLNPRMDIVFEYTVAGRQLQAAIKGKAKSINNVLFTSTPPMPQNEIISYLLFSTNMQHLSYLQVARLAVFSTFNVMQAKSGFQRVASLVDIKNIYEAGQDRSHQVLSIGKRFKNSVVSFEKDLESSVMRVLWEQILTNNLSFIVGARNAGEEEMLKSELSFEAMLRYMVNY